MSKTKTNCARCGGAKHRGRCKQPQAAVARAVEAPGGPALEVAATYGFRAEAVDGVLRIQQDAAPDESGTVFTHQIDLSMHEAGRLLAWIESQVDREAV